MAKKNVGALLAAPVVARATKELNSEEDLFDPALLAGLEVDGRPMTTDDILSGVMRGDTVTIVSCDGRKHTIALA